MAEELTFDDDQLRISKSADFKVSLEFPSDYDFDDYTASSFVVRASEDADSALLTITTTENANGSSITFDGNLITLLLKKEDINDLPEDATDSDDPWVGVCEWVVTDADALVSRLGIWTLVVERGVVR